MAWGRSRDVANRREPGVAAAANQHSALAGVLPHVLRLFRREPAMALTAAYLIIALAGIYFDYSFYQKGFGIPILGLSQIGDYLVAGLQRPMAILLMLLMLPLCWFADWLNVLTRRRYAAASERLRALPMLRWWQVRRLRYLDWNLARLWPMRIFYVLIFFGYGWMFVGGYATFDVAMVKRGAATQVAVRLVGANTDMTAAAGAPTWSYLGAVSNYVFLYDHVSRRPLVLPVNAIASLRLTSVAKPAARWWPLATKP